MEYRLNIKNKYKNKVNHLKLTSTDLNSITLKYIIDNSNKNYHYQCLSSLTNNDKKNIEELLSLHGGLIILLNKFNSEDIQYLKQKKIKYAFNFPIQSYQAALELIDIGTEEICVHGPLGFNKAWQEEIKRIYGIQIRVTPQYSQIFPHQKSFSGLRNFFIPPRFLKDFNAIDIIDFDENNIIKEETLYKIYAIDRRWDGNLNELIEGLNVDIDERYLIKDESLNFVKSRENCKQKCLEGRKCGICNNLANLSIALSKFLPNY